jgi:hypothetical protein
MRAPSDIPRRYPLTSHRSRWAIAIAVVVLIVLIASASHMASFYADFLWFRSVDLSSVWTKTITIELGLGTTFTVVFFSLLWGNLWLADRLAPNPGALPPGDELVARWQELAGAHMPVIRFAVAAAFGLIGGISAHAQWNNWLLFSNAQPFTTASSPWKNGVDPLNHMNDGFYVFRLPFLDWIVGWAFSALVVTLLLCLVAHYLNGGVRPHSAVQRVSPHVKAHLSVLLAVLALVEGVSYYLQRLSLVLATNSLFDGADYKDVHAVRPALILLIAISVIAAGLFLYNVRQQGWLLPVVAVALWGLVWVLVANVYPALVQALVVNPAQNVKEAPYIASNIAATTAAYGLDGVSTQTFQGSADVTGSEVTGRSPLEQAAQQSLANVTLLDANLTGMNSVFTKQEGFRGYYSMSGPSTDRYDLGTGPGGSKKETQVLVSARELNSSGAPGSWVNLHLQYTHGYGAVVAPANQSGVDPSDGYPEFTLTDVPPTGQPSVSNQPRIYFDTSEQSLGGYVIADSNQPELDYEQANNAGNEVTNHYDGSGGVAAGGILRRIAFAINFGNYNILISGQVNADSKILYYRNVGERLHKAAPFLSYDNDPYPVIVNGRLYWVDDAYTTTNNFPYSQQAGQTGTARLSSSSDLANESFNYVRNSVKAVVDAYNGTMWFFVRDPTDPIIQTYERAFPKLFTPMSMADRDIPGITSHWRYPEDLFTVQTNIYATYHQQNTSVFYTDSQAWDPAQNPASGEVSATSTSAAVTGIISPTPSVVSSAQEEMPIYELVALPGQTRQSFVLVQPFVPHSGSGDKQNLTAFMTASSDPDDYGQLTTYTIPAGQTVDGPYLVSTAVTTNQAISEEISLLDAHGSKVELGNVVLTPIGQTLIYVQPLYVEQSNNGVPRLDDVIVVYNQTAYHSGPSDPSLDEALCHVTNPSGARPFASYCAGATTTVPSAPNHTGTPRSSTTTTVPRSTAGTTTTTTASTTPALPTHNGTLVQDLAGAEQDFALAKAALKQGDLGTYQSDVEAGEALVALADKLATTPETTTTTTAVTTATPTTKSPHATGTSTTKG